MREKNFIHQFLRPFWKKPACFIKRELPVAVGKWLLDPKSFTKKIERLTKNKMHIKVLREGLELANKLSYEHGCFQCDYIYIREIQIYLNDDLLMYARSVMPKDALLLYKRRFRGLGRKPLGHMLFGTPAIKRGPFDIAKILPTDFEYHLAIKPNQDNPEFLWGRRSLFSAGKNLLLLSEVFSPDLIRLITDEK